PYIDGQARSEGPLAPWWPARRSRSIREPTAAASRVELSMLPRPRAAYVLRWQETATARPEDLAVPAGSDIRPERGTGKIMKYMLMFWVDESAEVTPEEDAAMMIAVKSWVEQMTERGVRLYGGPLRSA